MTFEALRVCIVDDDEFILTVVSSILTNLGVGEIKTAMSGREALSLVSDGQAPFNITFCDLNLPDLDGLALLHALQKRSFAGFVVLMTGEDQRILNIAATLCESLGLKLGGALQKPVSHAVLSTLLKDLTSSHGTENNVRTRTVLTEPQLRHAIANSQISAYFQPKVDTNTKAVVGCEALARLHSTELGLVSPAAFIPLAEETGLITEVFEAVSTSAIKAISKWQEAGLRLNLALNVSVASLSDLSLPDRLRDRVRESGLVPEQVIVEITESLFMNEDPQSLEVLCRLSLMGFKVSIDDFGTGYSSMSKLTRFPFSELKIDQRFVRHSSHDHIAATILKTSAMLGRELDMTVVAEGVERLEDWDAVRRAGVDIVQGFLVAKPMPEKDFGEWVRDWQREMAVTESGY